MKCKLGQLGALAAKITSFNLSIMKCKYANILLNTHATDVLI